MEPNEQPFRKIITTPWMTEFLDAFHVTDGHATYNAFGILTLAGLAANRRLYYPWSGYPLWPNQYTIFYGDSAVGKDASLKIIMDLWRNHLKHEAGSAKVMPGDCTKEFLMDTMHKRNELNLPASFLLITHEIGKMCGREEYKSGLTVNLCDWYDCPQEGAGRGTRECGEQEIRWLHPNVLTNSTPTAFKDFRNEVIEGGFLPRFNLVNEYHSREGIPYEWPLDADRIIKLGERLRANFAAFGAAYDDHLDREGSPSPLKLSIPSDSDCAKRLNKLKEWKCRALRENPIDRERAWINRLLEKAMKLAMATQILEGRQVAVMDFECLEQAIQMLHWITPGVFEAYHRIGATIWGEWQNKLLQIIQRRGEKGVYLNGLMSVAVQKLHLEYGSAKRIIESLVSAGAVLLMTKADAGGNQRQLLIYNKQRGG